MAMVATTIGAVAGPNLIEPMGQVADALGIPTLAGPFILAAAAYLSAGAVLFALLRPDPYLLARQLAETVEPVETVDSPENTDTPPPRGTSTIPPVGAGAWLGATVMILTQITMVAIMTMTPIHMSAHGHGMGAVGLVIGLHVGAMWLPSLVTGRIVDKVGRIPVAVAAGATLLATGALAALAPGDNLILLIIALILLGLGWNLGLVSGTAMVVDATVPENRPQTQGTIDVGVALAGAVSGLGSGAVMTATSFQTLAIIGGVLSLLIVPALVRERRSRA